VLIVLSHEVIDLLGQILDAGKGATADRLVGDQCEEPLHLIEPGAVGWNEVDVPTRTPCQPGLYPRMLVSAVVVDDQMHIQTCWDTCLNSTQKRKKLLMSVPWLAVSEYRAVEHIESRKECSGSVALVIVSDSGGVPQPQRKHGLSALQCLRLTLLIDAQHQGVFRWIQIQTDYIAQLLDEERIGGEFKTLGAMGLQAKELKIRMQAIVTFRASWIDSHIGGARSLIPTDHDASLHFRI